MDYTLPNSAMPLSSQLYQMAISMGASPANAAYLVGSAYQESGFKPNALGDFVNGKPTSFGLMQVGSPSLGSGSSEDQFRNYIGRLQKNAPDTWSAMNSAKTPEDVYSAQRTNPDWRMGIPGGRFAYANQVSASQDDGMSSNAFMSGIQRVLQDPNQNRIASQTSATGLPSPGQYIDEHGGIPKPPQVGAVQPMSTPASSAFSIIGQGLASAGQQMSQSGQQGNAQAMAMLQQRKSPFASYLQSLLNPGV